MPDNPTPGERPTPKLTSGRGSNLNLMLGDPNAHPLACRIRDLRLHAGITQVVAARHSHVTRRTWQRWESGERAPTVQRVPDIAAALNMPVAALFTPPGHTAIAEVVITEPALERIRTEGQPALDDLTQRLTAALQANLIAAASRDAAINADATRARSRRASAAAERERLRHLGASNAGRRRDRRRVPELTAE